MKPPLDSSENLKVFFRSRCYHSVSHQRDFRYKGPFNRFGEVRWL